MRCFFWWKDPLNIYSLLSAVDDAVHDLFDISEISARVYVEKTKDRKEHFIIQAMNVIDLYEKLPIDIHPEEMDFNIRYCWRPANQYNEFAFIIHRRYICEGKISMCRFFHDIRVSLGSTPSSILAMSRFYKAMRELMYRLKADRVVDSRWTDWDGEGIESEVEHAYFMFQPSGRQLLNERMELGENSPWILDEDYPGSTSDHIEIFVDPSEVNWYRSGGLSAM